VTNQTNSGTNRLTVPSGAKMVMIDEAKGDYVSNFEECTWEQRLTYYEKNRLQ